MTVHDAVARERRRALHLTVVAGTGIAVASTLLLLAAGAVLLGDSRWLELPRGLPIAVWVVVLVLDAVIAWLFWQRVRATTLARVAGAIEQEQSLRAGTVRGALEVAERGPLGRRAAAVVATDLDARGAVLAPSLRRRTTRHAAGAVAAAAAAAAVITLAVAPVFGDGLLAVFRPASAYRGSLLPPLGFRDLPSDVLRGERVQVSVAAPGRSSIDVEYRATGAEWQRARVAVRAGVAHADLGEMRSTLRIVASDRRTATDTAAVVLAERPFIGDVVMRAVYPAYLARPAETLPADGRVEVPRGTVLTLSGRASVALQRAALASGRDTVPLSTSGHTFTGRLIAQTGRTWTWVASAGAGSVDVPGALILDVAADSAPVVDLVLPASDTSVAPGETIDLRIGAGDDHGLASVAVEVRVERRGTVGDVSRRVLTTRPGRSWDGITDLRTDAAGGTSGDVLHIRAVATDASPWAQQGSSRPLRVRLRTDEERRGFARRLGDSAVAAAEAAARAQRELARRTDAAARARDRTAASSQRDAAGAGAAGRDRDATAMSHEEGERARTIAREQQQLVERVESLRDAAAKLEQGLRQAGALDSSLSRQLRDAQDLMRQALSPELMKQVQRIQQSAQQLNGDEARAAMRDLARMQQQLREQLEQSAEMLRRAAHEGAMQTLSDEARALAARERALADSAAAGRTDGMREAQALAERTKRYGGDVQALAERLARDRAVAASTGTGEARQAARDAEARLLEAAGAATPAGNGANARSVNQQPDGASSPGARRVAQRSRAAAAQMDRASQAMQQARAAQVKEWKQELTEELDRAVQETLQLAREESALEQRARADGAADAQLRSRQSAVQLGVDRTSERLREAGRRTSLLSGGAQRAMADARARVQAATRELAQGGPGRPARSQADALAEAAESLNRAAAALARDRERANSASSASGFSEMIQQLQEMAKRQGSINGQAQSLLQMPGGRQSQQGAQMSRALARQQRQLAQQLDDISEEAGGGRTGDLAREARQLADALDAGRLDARTAARQEQLYRRLLDAGRSLQKEEREDTERREARAATSAQPHVPQASGAHGREAQRFREPTWEELRGLSADERRAIIEYFRRINAAGTP